jgi:hypothetical protein
VPGLLGVERAVSRDALAAFLASFLERFVGTGGRFNTCCSVEDEEESDSNPSRSSYH